MLWEISLFKCHFFPNFFDDGTKCGSTVISELRSLDHSFSTLLAHYSCVLNYSTRNCELFVKAILLPLVWHRRRRNSVSLEYAT